MSDTLMNEFKGNMGAVIKLAELNAAATEKLVERNTALFTDLMKANMAHAKVLVDCADVQDVVDATRNYGRSVSEKLVAAGKANLATVEDARSAASDVVQEIVTKAQSQVEASVNEVKSRVEETLAVTKAPAKSTKKAA